MRRKELHSSGRVDNIEGIKGIKGIESIANFTSLPRIILP